MGPGGLGCTLLPYPAMEQLATLKATKFEVSPTGIATVTLSRPASLNALSGDLNREVEHHFQVTQPRCWLACSWCLAG